MMKMLVKNCFLWITIAVELVSGLRQYTKSDILKLRSEVSTMFYHAYDGYLRYADGYDELKPLSCTGKNTWISSSLTLIDALDTLAVMGNYSEFRRVVEYLIKNVDFDKDKNVSVFETNIRIVGGLLSAHLLSHKAGMELEVGYPCNGPLLRMAEKVASKLLPAFDTKTGMPYGTVNLKKGVPDGETSVTCTAGIGTFIVEFGALSRLTGDPIYEEVALNALYSLFDHRSAIGLFGNHIDVQSGVWTAQDAGIGAGTDSFYEYLVKGAIMLNRPELIAMFQEGRAAVDKYLKRDDWHIWCSMMKGTISLPVFQSLQAFWPGLLSLVGDVNSAMKSLHNMHAIWKRFGFLPEFYNIPNGEPGLNRESYPLRPELIESAMLLYRATGDPFLLEVGENILKSIEYSAKTTCGYATIKNVLDHRLENQMESFFLAETTKYLYLLFDPNNFLNTDGGHGKLIETPNGECIIETSYIFNTEAHPIDVGALRCCHDMPRESLVKDFDRKKFLGDSIRVFDRSSNDFEEQDEGTITNKRQEDAKVGDQSTEQFKKVLVSEIMSALSNTKKKAEESAELNKRFIEISNRNKNEHFDAVKNDENFAKSDKKASEQAKDNQQEMAVEEVAKEPIEIVKLSTSDALDSDNLVSISETELSEDIENFTSTESKTVEEKMVQKPVDSNNSIFTEFVEAILRNSVKRPKKNFDPQELLEKIRKNKAPRDARQESWAQRYDLMTCKAQPYLQRISVMGEFAY